MSYTPIHALGDLGQDDPQLPFQEVSKTPYGEGWETLFKEFVAQSPLPVAGNWLKQKYIENFDAGEQLSSDQIKQEFPKVANQYPDGGARHLVEFSNNKLNDEVFRQETINNMPDTKLSTGMKYLSMLVAGVSDPISHGGALAVGKLLTPIGIAGDAAIVARLGETAKASRVALRASLGVLEGGIATTPYAASSYQYYKDLHQDVSASDYLPLFLIGGGLGGLVRGIGGFHPILSPDTAENVKTVIYDQAESGKKVNVENLIKQGLYEQKVNYGELPKEELDARVGELNENINQTDSAIKDVETQFKTAKESNPELKDLSLESRESNYMLDKANALAKVSPSHLHAEHENFLKSIPDTDEFKTAMHLSDENPKNLSKQERSFLDNFNKGQERQLTENGVKNKTNQLKETNKQLESIDQEKQPEKFQELKNQKDILEYKISKAQERISELKEIESEPKNIRELRDKYMALNAAKDEFQSRLENTQMYNKLLENAQPLTQADLQKEAADIESFKSNDTFDPKVYDEGRRLLEQEEKPINVQQEELKDVMDNLEKNGKIAKEEANVLEQLKEEAANESKLVKALKQLQSCLTGRPK